MSIDWWMKLIIQVGLTDGYFLCDTRVISCYEPEPSTNNNLISSRKWVVCWNFNSRQIHAENGSTGHSFMLLKNALCIVLVCMLATVHMYYIIDALQNYDAQYNKYVEHSFYLIRCFPIVHISRANCDKLSSFLLHLLSQML